MLPHPKIWPRKVLILSFLLGLSLNCIHVEAKAEAEASPRAEAMPDPDPQYMMGLPIKAPFPKSPCEMTNQCCGMVNSNCCVGGQKCFTTYERKCEVEDNPQCRMSIERVCATETRPSCRLITDIVEREFTGSVCTPKPMTKCWNYEKKVCNPSSKPASQDVTWENDIVQPLGAQTKQLCYDETEYKCVEKVYSDVVTKQVEKTRVVPDSRVQCSNVPVVGEPTTIRVPMATISYRTACWDMPAPRCSTSMCGTGSCGQGQSVCSRNDYNTQTVCPTGLNNPNQNCQQVQRPVCYGEGPQCNAGSQQCCGQQTQRVCRQVPERKVEQVSQTVPGKVTYQRSCQTIDVSRTEKYFEPVQEVVNRTKKECPSSIVSKCANITVSEYEVVSEKKTQSITVQLPECNHQTVEDRFCHTFPKGDLSCGNTSIKKRLKITKLKCDGQEQKPVCKNVPKMDCRLGTSANCKMVPRQVCQNSCSDSPLCNQCNQFMQQGPGFESCPNSGCGTFIPSDPLSPVGESYGPSAMTELPGDYRGFYTGL